MASSRVETQIAWVGAAFKSVAFGAGEASDAFTFNAEDWECDVQLSADNDGTPATGDTVDFYIRYTSGDILGDTGSDYDTAKSLQHLARLNTYATDADGEDPQRKTVRVRTSALGFMVYAKNNSTGRAITVRARVIAHRPA